MWVPLAESTCPHTSKKRICHVNAVYLALTVETEECERIASSVSHLRGCRANKIFSGDAHM